MAQFTIDFCLIESCEELQYRDTTGNFGLQNPLGYGAPSVTIPASPSDYDSYVLYIWYPGVDSSGANSTASVTIDLLALGVPVPDSDGFYTWDIPYALYGQDPVPSGSVFARVGAVFTDQTDQVNTYVSEAYFQFIKNITDISNKNLLPLYNPACTGDCSVSQFLFNYMMLTPQGCCGDLPQFQDTVTWLYNNQPCACTCGC